MKFYWKAEIQILNSYNISGNFFEFFPLSKSGYDLLWRYFGIHFS